MHRFAYAIAHTVSATDGREETQRRDRERIRCGTAETARELAEDEACV